MILIGADTHKRSHTLAAVEAASGRMLAERTVPARRRCFEALLTCARGHGNERVWAIEDCRHVSGALERFLLAHGEAVVRVAPKLTVRERTTARERGKSDVIDAVAVARAALREGLEKLPAARLAGPELDVRLLVDHRERLVAPRTALSNGLRWHLHDLRPETEIPPRALTAAGWQTRIAARLARAEQNARVRIARDELRRVRELSRSINDLHAELAALVSTLAPRLLAERGCGVLTAAKLLGEIADVTRYATDAKLARSAGSAPIPASSGRSHPPPPHHAGNRQLNCALHRLAVTKGRLDPETAAYLSRRQAEGKTRREAIRCLKRYLARRVWHLLQPDPPTPIPTSIPICPRRVITIHCNRPIGTPHLT